MKKKKSQDNSEQKLHQLKLLLEFGKRISSERSLDSLLTLLAKEAKMILQAVTLHHLYFG